MAVRTVYDCDRCGSRGISEHGRLRVLVGYSPCPAGGSSEADYETVDLCQQCMVSILTQLVSKDKLDGTELVKMARTKIKARE